MKIFGKNSRVHFKSSKNSLRSKKGQRRYILYIYNQNLDFTSEDNSCSCDLNWVWICFCIPPFLYPLTPDFKLFYIDIGKFCFCILIPFDPFWPHALLWTFWNPLTLFWPQTVLKQIQTQFKSQEQLLSSLVKSKFWLYIYNIYRNMKNLSLYVFVFLPSFIMN
jgi:hypothetical protein